MDAPHLPQGGQDRRLAPDPLPSLGDLCRLSEPGGMAVELRNGLLIGRFDGMGTGIENEMDPDVVRYIFA